MTTTIEAKRCTTIQSIKKCVICAGNYVAKSYIKGNMYNRQRYDADCERNQWANDVVKEVAAGNFGFASEIAQTVKKYGRISEKQAYWISKAAFENEINAIYGNDEVHTYFCDLELLRENDWDTTRK